MPEQKEDNDSSDEEWEEKTKNAEGKTVVKKKTSNARAYEYFIWREKELIKKKEKEQEAKLRELKNDEATANKPKLGYNDLDLWEMEYLDPEYDDEEDSDEFNWV